MDTQNRFFSKRLKIKQNTAKLKRIFLDELLFQGGVNFFQSEKLNWCPSQRCPKADCVPLNTVVVKHLNSHIHVTI